LDKVEGAFERFGNLGDEWYSSARGTSMCRVW